MMAFDDFLGIRMFRAYRGAVRSAIILFVLMTFLAVLASAAILPPSTIILQQGNQIIINTTYREPVCLSTMTLTIGAGINVPINNRPPIPLTCSRGAGVADYVITQSLTSSGNYSFFVRVLDWAGNFREDTKPFSVTIPSPAGCGDRVLNTSIGEQCDDGNTRSGDGCNSFCQSETCGNNIIDLGEVCDGTNLNSLSCSDLPQYSGGNMQCSSDCRRFIYSNCTAVQPPVRCGNGIIDLGEQCDGLNWGSITTCVSYDSTFTGGVLTCDRATCRFNTDQCVGPTGGTCGDGQLAVGEQCDGRARNSCSDFDSFYGNGIICTSNCTYDTSGCQKATASCGDGEVNPELDENCDKLSFLPNVQTCSDLPSFSGGTLKCKADCSLDVSSCTSVVSLNSSCSNNVKDGTESDVDCGGICGRCAENRACTQNQDCASNYCNGGRCVQASCSDGVLNGLEAGTDCGAACSLKCQEGSRCQIGADCESNFCSQATNTCVTPSCNDGLHNGLETDVDCGGSCSTKCSLGQQCDYANDCASSFCDSGFCSVDRNLDSDFDGIPDFWEDKYGLDKNNPDDAMGDLDRDGFNNLQEYQNGTDPTVPDKGGKSRLLAWILFMVGLVFILGSSGFLYWYREYYYPPSRRQGVSYSNPQAARPAIVSGRQPALGGRLRNAMSRSGRVGGKSDLLRRLLERRRSQSRQQGPVVQNNNNNASQGARQAEVKTSDVAKNQPAQESKQPKEDIFEKLKSLSSKKDKK